jgi:hypothetical protein
MPHCNKRAAALCCPVAATVTRQLARRRPCQIPWASELARRGAIQDSDQGPIRPARCAGGCGVTVVAMCSDASAAQTASHTTRPPQCSRARVEARSCQNGLLGNAPCQCQWRLFEEGAPLAAASRGASVHAAAAGVTVLLNDDHRQCLARRPARAAPSRWPRAALACAAAAGSRGKFPPRFCAS